MPQLFRNNAFSALGASLTDVATTLTVTTGHGDRFPAVTAPDFFMLTLQNASNNIEIVRVTARTAGADSMTIQRAQEGTTARAWNIDDVVELRLTAFALNPLSLLEGSATAAAVRAILDVPTRAGGDASGTWNIGISGNAATATTLQTARNINGVSFNGSADITLPTVNTTGDQSVGGVKTFTSQIVASGGVQGNVTGNAGTVTNGVYTTGDQTIGGTKTFSSAPIVPGINGGQLAGMRNLLINGNFQINQRGYVSGTNVGAANTYTLDRWRVVTSGQNVTFTASGNGNQITAPAGGIEQVIEGINIGGGTYVLNWTGTATATVNGTARAKGESFTLPANTNATVRLIGGTASQVQLEPGTAATPFEHRPIGAELALCQRYYEVGSGAQLYSGYANSGSVYYNTVRYAVPKRAVPSSVVFSDVANSGFAAGAPTLGANQVDAFNVHKTANATNAAAFFQYSWTSSAEL